MNTEGYEMSPERLQAFLDKYPMVAVASLRKSGAPLVVPMGYLYRDGAFYLAIRRGRASGLRMQRDERVSLSIFDHELPPSWVVVEGRAREVPDEDHEIKRALLAPMMARNNVDLEEYLRFWTSGKGRAVYKVTVDRMISMDGEAMEGLSFNDWRANYDASLSQNTG